MNIKLLPFFEAAEENKRRHGKEDLFDAVIGYTKTSNNRLNLEVYKYKNFCTPTGEVVDLLFVFMGNRYETFKI